ncbi:PQQ-like beta-propeller repeat protein [Streptosporangium sp. NBC_01810]|uniref:outer membrane protein assembly factor BamB family protein n=1 Tax=Streptosporangium sp. NBC_01810 TaxID=2975951 RepID=UPI002DDBDBFA|nr:PQQ-binding-like beta-propeller repeat protein [Streptosporangium sp. NBC_01810]WSA22881.1 PQQ-like beta-propeller repeat protein [Streptosporangium sp. NBC_01810]
MSFRRPLHSVLSPAIAAVALLVVPAATPVLRSSLATPAPITGIHISGKDGTVTAKISSSDRTLWKSTQTSGLLDQTNLLTTESESRAELPEDLEDEERKAAVSTGRYVAAETEIESGNPNHPDTQRRITVIDALTGLPTWSILSGYPGGGRARPFFYLMGAAPGKIIIDVPALRTIRALDPLDGTILWETDLPGDCVSAALPSADPQADEDDPIQVYSLADRNLAVAMTRCEDRRTSLIGIDPATGRVRWERRFPPSGLPELSLEEGVSILSHPNSVTIIDKGGLILADDLVYRSPSWVIAAGAVIISDGDWSGNGSGVRSISRSSGQITWSRPDLLGEVGTAAGKIHVESENALIVLDPADGHTLVTLSAPLTEKDIEAALAAPPGWGVRGGVPAADWPDACALLPPAELTSRPGTGGYVTTPIAAPPELGLTTPLACELTPERKGTLVTVSVVRVYTSVKEATEAMETLSGEKAAPDVAEHASYFDDERDAVTIRHGRVIVTVEAFGDRTLLRQAGRITGEQLRELYPSRKGSP